MTDARSRFAKSNFTGRDVEASRLLAIEMTGVTPLPPAKATTGRSLSLGQNTPAGFDASSTSPSATLSCSQFDTRPPSPRFTVTVRSGSTPGALDLEYDRSSPSPRSEGRGVGQEGVSPG